MIPVRMGSRPSWLSDYWKSVLDTSLTNEKKKWKYQNMIKNMFSNIEQVPMKVFLVDNFLSALSVTLYACCNTERYWKEKYKRNK